MALTVERSTPELAVRQRGAGIVLGLGACVYGVVAWLLFRDEAALSPSLDALLQLSVFVAGVALAFVGTLTLRYPSQIVLDRARNRIRIRFLPGASRFDFEGPLHELSRIDLVDVGMAVYTSLVRADRLAAGPSWANAFPGLREWAFRASSEESRVDAGAKAVRLRVTMRNGEQIALDRLTASPERLRALAHEMEEFAGVVQTPHDSGQRHR